MTRLLWWLDALLVCPTQDPEGVHKRLMALSRSGYTPSLAEVELLVQYLLANPLVSDYMAANYKLSHNNHFDAWNLIRRQPRAPQARDFWKIHRVEVMAVGRDWNPGLEGALGAFDSSSIPFDPASWTDLRDLLMQVIHFSYRHGWREITGVELEKIQATHARGRHGYQMLDGDAFSNQFVLSPYFDMGRIVDVYCSIGCKSLNIRTTRFPILKFRFEEENGDVRLVTDFQQVRYL
jgi:hypothetical protein